MTWMLLYVTLNTQNNRSASGYPSTAHEEGFPWLLGCLKSIKAAARAQNTDTEVSPIAFTAVFTDTGLALPNY